MGIFDESYSSVQLARILGIHRVTVTNWIKQGALKAARTPGGRYKVAKRDLIAFLDQRGIRVPSFIKTVDKKLVVAIDDEEHVLNTLKEYFAREDLVFMYELKTFLDAIDAALYIGDSKPDTVLLNLVMPQLDGFHLAQKIKEIRPQTRIVAITSHGNEEDLVSLKRRGVDALVTKPLALKALKKALEDTMGEILPGSNDVES